MKQKKKRSSKTPVAVTIEDIELMGFYFVKNPPKGCEIVEVNEK